MKAKKRKISRREFLRDSVALSSVPLIASCTYMEQPENYNELDYINNNTADPYNNDTIDNPNNQNNHTQNLIEKRLLGKTGLWVSVVSFGGGSQFQLLPNGQWEPFLEKAVELGVNYFDTASEYFSDVPNKWSEEQYGEILPAYRDKIYIATKFTNRNLDEAKKEFDESLKRLKVDYVDVYLVHDVSDPMNILEPLWKWMEDLQTQGVVKFIGFSSMSSASKSKEFIETYDPDVALLALSPFDQDHTEYYQGYFDGPLPVALTNPDNRKNTGVLAMKTMREVKGIFTTEESLIHGLMKEPRVAAALVGHAGSYDGVYQGTPTQQLEENIALANKIVGPTGITDDRLSEIKRKARLFARRKKPVWMRPDYRDDGHTYNYC